MSLSSDAGAVGAAPLPLPTATAGNATPTVLLVGNPNVGKTSLFNHLAQRNERVGNYPGVTVERRAADVRLASGRTISLVDVPGAYSLAARSAEEQVAFQAMIGWGENPVPDLVVIVLDAGQLTRNLYLALQLMELELPLVMALNMIDEAGERTPPPAQLSQLFGVPCVATNARLGQGNAELLEAIERALAEPPRARLSLHYPPALIRDVDRVVSALPEAWRKNVERDRALALWALSSIEPADELVGVPEELRARTEHVLAEVGERDLDREIIESRYIYIEQQLAQAQTARAPGAERAPEANLTERIDRVLLHPAFGFAIFVALMVTVFQSLFSWADPVMGLIEEAFGAVHGFAQAQLAPGFFRDLVTQGLINGVGNVVVFLPQIMLLFLFIGLLEDSGYMARVAYLMDRVLRSVGLHGRAFVPMLSGFACAIPAVMATRTMERRRDRLLTMLVVPLMSCSARLPVYTLIIAALFPPSAVFGWLPLQGMLLVAMYLFSIVISLVAAAVLGRTVVRGRSVPLILELPRYRLPGLGSVLRMVWLRAKTFLTEAGTIILALTVGMWVLLSYPKYEPAEQLAAEAAREPAAQTSSPEQSPRVDPGGAVLPPSDAEPSAAEASPDEAELAAQAEALQIEHSFGGRLGKLLEPALAPLGFDWKLGVGIIGAFAAREVFVSVLGIVYGVGEVDEEAAPLRDRMRAETRADGQPRYTPLVGLSLMVFFALACQCMSTVAVVKRETQSWRWPAFMFVYMTALAWMASFIVFQLGRALGF